MKQKTDEPESEEAGSTEYINNHKIDMIIKKGKDKLKHVIHVSVDKLTKTKKQIVKDMAVELEKAGYPVKEISDRLTKSLKGLVGHSTIAEALEAKYKDPVKAAEALKKNIAAAGRSGDRNDRELLKKPYKQVDGNDILKSVLPKAVLEKVAVYQMNQVEYWKQQLRQSILGLVELEKKTTKYSDAEFRTAFKEFVKRLEKQIKTYDNPEQGSDRNKKSRTAA